MADSSSSSSVNTNLPDVTSTRSDHVPVQVTTIQLNKENYSRWSPAITMGIAGQGRIAYVNGRKVEPAADSMAWDTWFLEDNQVKTWIVNSVSPDIQPLILRKKTARDMWIILEQIVEAEEQRRMLSIGRKGEEQSAYVSRAPVGTPRSSRKCTHCKKIGHTRDFCWDLHPEKNDSRGKPSSGRKHVSSATSMSDDKGSISAEQIRELRAYLSKIDVGQADTPDEVKINQALAVSGAEEQEGDRRFGQVYSRRGSCTDKVINDEEVTPNPNPTSFLDDPSGVQKQNVGREIQTEKEKEDLPIALRKGVSEVTIKPFTKEKAFTIREWIELNVEKESTQPGPLGLKLTMTPSFMELVQAKLSQGQPPDCDEKQSLQAVLNNPSAEKLKASNFAASFLKIGSWERVSRYDGDLAAKCYFAKRKLVWEVLEGGLKSKIEIQWSDIISLRAIYRQNHPDQLEVELSKVPHFFRETNPQPRKHTLWQAANDFTGGQAVAYSCVSKLKEQAVHSIKETFSMSDLPLILTLLLQVQWWILLTAKNRVSAILMMGTWADVQNIMNQLTVTFTILFKVEK
ncbi:hypothetical protein EJ110_NYTH57733 [Nymphaea thermarum]|nr:hypothetical protein EJ110_NYTH57733 [Nymphaea thermarum]